MVGSLRPLRLKCIRITRTRRNIETWAGTMPVEGLAGVVQRRATDPVGPGPLPGVLKERPRGVRGAATVDHDALSRGVVGHGVVPAWRWAVRRPDRDAHVQRLRGRGRVALRRHGPDRKPLVP